MLITDGDPWICTEHAQKKRKEQPINAQKNVHASQILNFDKGGKKSNTKERHLLEWYELK